MRKIKFYNSLRFQLIIIVVFFIIIPVLVLFTLLSNTVKDTFNEKYSAVAQQSITETGGKINYLLSDIEDYTTTILANRTFLDMVSNNKTPDSDINEILRGFLASRNDIDGISLINTKSTYSIGTNKTTPLISIQQMLSESNDSRPVWLSTVKQNIKILSGISTRYYFSIARNIIDFNTLENYGTLDVDIEEVLLEQAYENLIADDGEVFIIDANGTIVSHPDKSKIGKTIDTSPYYQELKLAKLIKTSGNIPFYEDGQEEIAFYSELETNGWHIIKTISKNDLYAEITQIQSFFLIGAGIYATLMLMFILGLSFQYTEPMLKIIHDLKRVEKGDLTVRTKVNTTNEISELSDSINNMIGEMELLIDKLVTEERNKREVELEALHAQINPHFLYNTLNTIKWMAKIQGANSVSNAIVALVKLLRISINISSDFITLKEEMEYIQNYVVIQKLRFNEDFEIDYQIPDELMDLLLPKLILQPIIENSIIYGMENAEKLAIIIESFIEDNNNDYTIRIVDNGPGIPEEVLSQISKDINVGSKFSKAGLNNISQRIKLFCGEQYGLEILTSEGNGTTVLVRLPIKRLDEIGGSNV